MKKFFKWSAITAGILLALGLILILAATVTGGHKAVISMAQGIGEINWTELDEVLESVDNMEFNIGEDGVNVSFGTNAGNLTVNGVTVSAGEQEESFASEEIRKLDLSLSAGEFLIRKKDAADGKIDLCVTGFGECKYEVIGDTLVIDGYHDNIGIHTGSADKMIVDVPADMKLEKVTAEMGAGQLIMDEIAAGEMEIHVGAGALELDSICADEFLVQLGAGQVIAEDVDILNAAVDVSMGECSMTGEIRGNLKANCDMGDLTMELLGSAEDHNYSVNCSAGNIDLDGYQMSVLAGQKEIDNEADSEYELSCNLGNITVKFEE